MPERVTSLRADIDPERLRRLVESLPAPRTRLDDPAAMEAADALIHDGLAAAGWPVELRPFVESFGGTGELIPVVPGVNVVATKDGESRDAVVVVAHHDTVPGTGGADDNGSGVAGLIEVARLLGPMRLRRSVVLAAVDHEELGFVGARHLVRELSASRRVVGAFVLEMLAYTDRTPGSQRLPAGIGAVYPRLVWRLRARGLRGDFTTVIYRRSSRFLATAFADGLRRLAGPDAAVPVRAPADLPILGPALARTVPLVRNFARSDHVPFWEAGLPAVQITDTANFRNPHYHLPSDTPDTLDYEQLADVVAATAHAVEQIAGTATADGPMIERS